MYSDIIQINKNFQSSVNLELDLNSEQKIGEYIPTSDICDVLKRYMKSFVSKSGERATTLVGPYGKGKSFLLLVLSYLISQDSTSKAYVGLLKKIKKIDGELFKLITDFNCSDKKLLPIIINSNYDNLNQAFMLALNEALKREKISSVIPVTAYSICLRLLDSWDEDQDMNKRVYIRCQEELHISKDKLRMGLRDYSPEAYEQFVELYNCVTHGQPFNPLVNDDIVHVYSEVNHVLKERGYTGMFIIFDEFSKFLESSGSSQSKDLKIIQDFAEVCTRSGLDEQMHICCVTHKSFNLYKTEERADSFKTVEGRFKEVRFNRSLNENYQIISAAIDNRNAKDRIAQFVSEHESFYSALTKFQPFSKEVDLKQLFQGCFPLNPLTVYSLIQLSELVAQNERTLFTFISDTDDNSLNSFIRRNDSGLFNVDKIYDYFSPILKREEGNQIRNIWFRTEGTLARVEDQDERKIIKALSVILMLNNFEVYPPNEEMISLATMLPEEIVKAKITDLIESHYLRKNLLNNLLTFTSSNNKEIEDRINVFKQTRINSVSYDTVLDEINDSKFLLPRRYNEQNKITRYYQVSFITEDQLEKLTSFDGYREYRFSDGLVLNLIRTEMNEEQIRENFARINDQKTILRYPKKKVDSVLFEELIRYLALQEILNKGGNDPIVTSEVELLLEETAEDTQKLIKDYFENNCAYISSLAKKTSSFNEMLSDVMDAVYNVKIVFNNELINKNTLTKVYQKSANNIIDDILNNRETEYSATSPETTIKTSIVEEFKQENVRLIIDEIKQMIIDSEKQTITVTKLIEKYTKEPYGIRKGIIPVLLAQCIKEMPENILFYFKNKEMDLNAGNLVKAVYTDGDYSFRAAKGSGSQAEFLADMIVALGDQPSGNFRNDTKKLCEDYRRFFVGLPMIMRNADSLNTMGMSEEMIEYKKYFLAFSLNPYDLVFEKPLRIFKTDSYEAVKDHLCALINGWQGLLDDFKKSVVDGLKNEFGFSNETSLHMGLITALSEMLNGAKPVLSEANSSIYATIEKLSFEDMDAINQLSNTVLGVFIEDWTDDRKNELSNRMRRFFDEIQGSKRITKSTSTIDNILDEIDFTEYSEMGKLFQNQVESAIAEFGEGVSTEEKIAILSMILKNII